PMPRCGRLPVSRQAFEVEFQGDASDQLRRSQSASRREVSEVLIPDSHRVSTPNLLRKHGGKTGAELKAEEKK
ncbi:MAG: hypothetical protein P8J33_12780, partial [Pirellulaceae bacterium]|nr:hypothetical protein [Pirellulaceae bacterium]